MRVLMCNTNLSPAILASSAYSGQEIRPDKVFNDVDINENAKLMKDYDTDGNFLKFSIQEFKELTADRQVNFIRDLLDYSTAFGTTNDALTEEGFKALIDLITIFNNSN
ncbi:MAG: hypothetical protein LBD99_04465, partial [Candidatus Margulisbacteria bacterium]|nr:hypothetical protein [Candidatus Margulisiibacteriota bacterium]